ncbi:OmpW/AlkL family protein [Rubrivivax sp. RP6-9]|uniref:OmpW/AlkL family protein n=1 Tax=Rubrivivax sp. RP6-9 TaxID=3415750 RepID=UPI003CC639F7
MNTAPLWPAVGLAGLIAAGCASAQDNMFKIGAARYTTHSRTDGITGVGVPAGADAETGDATTLLLTYERMFTPSIGAELALGVPPRIEAKATGSVAFLGDDILSARNVSPTLFVNYHFGARGDGLRPYLGAGLNYTRFTGIRSRLAPDVRMGDSTGWAVQAGFDYALDTQWGLFASVAALRVKSKLVASGSTVLQTTIDFRPVVYSFGAAYRF